MARKKPKPKPPTPPPETPVSDQSTPKVQYGPQHIPALISELLSLCVHLRRDAAGYNFLNRSLLSASGQLPAGERTTGLPVFEFSASAEGADGRLESIRCAVDLQHVPPAYIQHVMLPIVASQGHRVLEDVQEIKNVISIVEPLLSAILAPKPPEPQNGPTGQ